ncbi:DMT family transporter [Alphaproteobacteria bacterium]|nr:DMT family transporter [Alphaproteobacteria bacterium]
MSNKIKQNTVTSVLFMISASLLIAGTTILAKILGTTTLGPPINPMQISNARFIFAFILIFIFFITTKSKIIMPNYKVHLGRSVCGWIGISILFGASSIIPITDATAIIFTNPIFTMLLAIVLLGEKVKPIKWIAVIITFWGALILIRPENNIINHQFIIIILIIGAFVLGLESVFIKMLTLKENPKQILLINNSIGLLISSIPICFIWITPTTLQILAMVGIGLLMLCAQACFIQALRRSKAHFAVPYFYSTLIFVAIYDFFIFNITPDDISFIGASLIIIGGLSIYISEIIKKPNTM